MSNGKDMTTIDTTEFVLKTTYDTDKSLHKIWSHLLKKSFMENFIFCAVNQT